MKLATYKDGSRDGQLVVVAQNLERAHYATGICNTLQAALDDWNFFAPQLQDLYLSLNRDKSAHSFPFVPQQCMAPLPRAYQWVEGFAFVHHVELLRKACKFEVPDCFGSASSEPSEPVMYQGGSDGFLGACDDIVVPSEGLGIDFGAEIAVVTGDIPMGADADRALAGVRLLMLANSVSLRNLIPDGLAKGLGSCQSKPATAFSPVALTPDELGPAWANGRLDMKIKCTWNGHQVGLCDAGVDMTFHFGQLIAHVCKTRNVRAGSIVGSGTVSNKDGSRGYSCIAEKRAIEMLEQAQAKTDYMRFGDTIEIEMPGPDGQSFFGRIVQEVQPWVSNSASKSEAVST